MNKKSKIIVVVVVILAGFGVCQFLFGFLLLGSSALFTISLPETIPPYFMTVSEVLAEKENMVDRQIRISGAVLGESIEYDEANQQLSFFIVDIPGDLAEVEQQGGLATVLENAVNDLTRERIQIMYIGEQPGLLRHMAQAILAGELRADGIFYADEILLKCPTRYEEALPEQTIH